MIDGVKFAYDVHLSEAEMKRFDPFISLYADHVSLTNDIWSFDKEMGKHDDDGGILINGVAVLDELLSVGSVRAAKVMTHDLILDVEDRLGRWYQDFCRSNSTHNASEQRFVEGILINLAGHIFYSATISRYRDRTRQAASSV